MSQDPINPPESEPPDPTEPKPKKRKRRLWLKILLALVILVVGLVALGPTIASTGMVRSIVLGKVNENLNGSVEIADWSLGWFSPISVSGIKVFDQDKALILEISQIKLGVSILGAARQNFALGDDNVVDVASFVVKVDETGKSNLERLPKAGTPKPPAPAGQPPAAPSGGAPPMLPNISGKFTVNILQGTVESKNAPPVHVAPSTIVINIPDINKPIENTIKLAYRVGDGPEARIEVSGDVHAVRENVLSIDKLTAGQRITLGNVDLSAAEPFIKGTKLAGLLNGGIDVKAEGLTGVSAAGSIDIRGVSVSGGPLGADTFKTAIINIPVNVTRTVVDGKSIIKLESVGVQMSQASVKVTGQVPEDALKNLAAQQPPGADGTISIVADVTDLKDIATQLKNTLKLQQGVSVTGGAVHEQIDIGIAKDRVTLAQKLNASAKGMNGSQAIELQPINVTVQASALPKGTPLPELRNLKLAFESVFATIQGGGESLAKIDVNGNFDLAKLRAEAGQFVDFKNVQMEGKGDLAINTAGDVTDPNAPINAGMTVNLQNVKVTGVASQGINQDRLTFSAKGQLTRKENAPTGISNAVIAIVSGDPASPLLGGQINADVVMSEGKTSVPKWDVKFDANNLATLQDQYGGLVPNLSQQGIKIVGGQVHVAGAGKYDGTTASITTPLTVALQALTMTKDGRNLMRNEALNVAVAGSASVGADQTSANISTLSVTTNNNILGVSKVGDAPLTLNIAKNGTIQGAGTIALMADLKTLAAIGKQFAPPQSADQPQLTGGTFSANLSVATVQDTKIKLDGQLSGLSIETGGRKTIDNEQLTVNMNVTAPADLKGATPITVDGKIGSSFFTTNLSGIKVAMNQASPYDMLQSANVDVQVPDIPKLYALANAMGAAAKPAPGTEPAPPLQITSGNAAIKLNVARDTAQKTTNITLSEANVNGLSMHRGNRDFKFDKPLTFNLKAAIKAASPIQSIQVTQLNGDLGVATLEMPSPIKIDMSTDKPSYNGAVKVVGSIDAVTPLLAVMQNADPLPYSGQYQLSETIATSGSNTSLNGAIDINQFKAYGPPNPAGRRDVAFAEDQIAIKNDVALDLTSNTATVNSLTVDMPKSQAVGVKFNGKVSDWMNARQIAGASSDKARLDLTYDLEKIWPIVKPMLSPDMQKQYANLKIKGKYTKTFTVSGAYPDRPTAQESLASLNVDGGLAVELLDLPQGLELKAFEQPFSMKAGTLKLLPAPASDARKLQVQVGAGRSSASAAPRQITASTAIANNGALNLDGITLDLTKPAPVLSIPAKHVLLRDVKLNAVLAASLGKMGALVFSDAKTAEGLLTFTVNECNGVPMGDLLLKKNNAKASFTLAVDDLLLDGPVLQVLSAAADLGTGGIRGSVAPSTIVMSNGQIDTNMTILIDKAVADARGRETLRGMPLKLTGGIGLEKQDLRNFVVDIAPELEIREVRKVAPNGAVIPLRGTASSPQIDVVKFIRDNAIKSLIGGQQQDDGKGGKPQNPLGGILDQLTKPKK